MTTSTTPQAKVGMALGAVAAVGITAVLTLGGGTVSVGADADSMIVGDTIVLDVLANDEPNDAPITSVSFESADATAEIVDGGADGRDRISFTSDVAGQYSGTYAISVDGEEATGEIVIIVDEAPTPEETPEPEEPATEDAGTADGATDEPATPAEPTPAPEPEPDAGGSEPTASPTAAPTTAPTASPTATPEPSATPSPTTEPDPADDNRAPRAVADTAESVAGASVTVAVLANDTDPDGDQLSLVSVSATGPGSPTASIASGQVTVTTPQAGTVTVTYRVTDGSAEATGTLTVTVTAAPDAAPVAVADAYEVTYGTVVLLSVIGDSASAQGADQDEDRSTLRITQVRAFDPNGSPYGPAGSTTSTSWGQATITSDGRRISYSAIGFANGARSIDTFQYRITDAGGQVSDWVTVTLDLNL